MYKSLIIIVAHVCLAGILTFIVLFTSKLSTLLIVFIFIFWLLAFYLKCNDCPAFQIENSYNSNSSSDIIWRILLGKKYKKTDKQAFTLVILYISFLLTLMKIIGIITLRIFKN